MIIKLRCCWNFFFFFFKTSGWWSFFSINSADTENGGKVRWDEPDMGTNWARVEQLWWTWACPGSRYCVLQSIAPLSFMLFHYLPCPGFLLLWITESILCTVLPLNWSVPWTASRLQKIANRRSHPRSKALLFFFALWVEWAHLCV